MGSFGIPLFPEQASTFAKDVDALYLFIVAVSAFFALAVSIAVVVFGIVFRRRHPGEIGARIEGNLPLELLWSIIPTMISMVMFGWGASAYFTMRTPPAETMNIYAVGKQWMWKFQHVEGQREINELHVPLGRPIKVTITSEDVIHSLYFPAFRTKMDAIPGSSAPIGAPPRSVAAPLSRVRAARQSLPLPRARFPVRNGRLARGVGCETDASQ